MKFIYVTIHLTDLLYKEVQTLLMALVTSLTTGVDPIILKLVSPFQTKFFESFGIYNLVFKELFEEVNNS